MKPYASAAPRTGTDHIQGSSRTRRASDTKRGTSRRSFPGGPMAGKAGTAARLGQPGGAQPSAPVVLRLALADDHVLFRESLKSALALQPNVQVVAEAGRVDDVLPMLLHTSCDALLLDLQMDRSALSEIAAFAEKTAVIVVTASETAEDALAAIRAGARGVIFKRFAVEHLMSAIRAVTAGEAWMPASLQAQLAAELRSPAREILTEREREIVRHVALGLRNAEVAQKLFITEQTVKTHLNNIFQKLGVRDRVELALYAARVGIITVREKAP